MKRGGEKQTDRPERRRKGAKGGSSRVGLVDQDKKIEEEKEKEEEEEEEEEEE